MASLVQFGVSIGTLMLSAVSLFGWGTAVRHLAKMANGSWPVTIGLGLGAILMLGGLLNVARLAFAWILWSLTAAGVAFAIVYLARSWRSTLVAMRETWGRPAWIEAASAGIFIALATGFAI